MDVAPVAPARVAKPLRLRPFRGLRLAPARVGDPAAVRLLARPYSDHRERVAQWQAGGLLTVDAAPGLYLHEYSPHGATVRGLVGALALDHLADDPAQAALFPHEAVHPEQVVDLSARMEQVGVNPAPILMTTDSPGALTALFDEIAAEAPTSAFTDRQGQAHRVWQVTSSERIAKLDDALADVTAVLADGHHRYAAYLHLHARRDEPGWRSGLAMLVDQADTPLFLGPIHRTLHATAVRDVVHAARRLGVPVTSGSRADTMALLDEAHLLLSDGIHWHAVRPELAPGQLSVEWLHQQLLPLLDPAPAVQHHHTLDEALAAAGPSTTVVALSAPTYAAVEDVVSSGRLLPEKATSFQPKPTVGVIMRSVEPLD